MEDKFSQFRRGDKTLEIHLSHDADVYVAILEGDPQGFHRRVQIEFPSGWRGGGRHHGHTQQVFYRMVLGEGLGRITSSQTTQKFTGEITKGSEGGCSLTLVAQSGGESVLKIVGFDYGGKRVEAQMEFGPQDELKDWFPQLAEAIEEDNRAAREGEEGSFQFPERES